MHLCRHTLETLNVYTHSIVEVRTTYVPAELLYYAIYNG